MRIVRLGPERRAENLAGRRMGALKESLHAAWRFGLCLRSAEMLPRDAYGERLAAAVASLAAVAGAVVGATAGRAILAASAAAFSAAFFSASSRAAISRWVSPHPVSTTAVSPFDVTKLLMSRAFARPCSESFVFVRP